MTQGHTFGHKMSETHPPLSYLFHHTPGGIEGGVPRRFVSHRGIDGSTTSVRHQIHINSNIYVTWDKFQWIINRLVHTGDRSGTGTRLKPFAYIATEKRILRRVLLENDITPDANGITNLDTLPPTFTNFIKGTMA